MNLGDYRAAMLDELSKTSADTFHTTAILNRFINRGKEFAEKYKPWEQTQTAFKFTPTLTGDETDGYWDYPETFITDSIYRLSVGTGSIASDERYKPLTFTEYLNYKEDVNASEKIWSDHKRQYFISPIVTGAPVITVWGHEVTAAMTDDADTTVFNSDAVIEEGILGYAMGLALMKMRGSYYAQGEKRKAEALALFGQAWADQRKKLAIKRTETAEVWKHTDFMRISGSTTRNGSFNAC